jgi:hypothetical protein
MLKYNIIDFRIKKILSRGFERRLLRGVFDQRGGGSGAVKNFILRNSVITIIRMIKPRTMIWWRPVARDRGMRNAYKILFRKTDWKRPLGRPEY